MNPQNQTVEKRSEEIIDLYVVGTDEQKQNFIIVYENGRYTLPRESVQTTDVLPETLSCIVTKYTNGNIRIQQNLEPLIAHYLPKGSTAEFFVKSGYGLDSGGTYDLQDCRYGFHAYLKNDRNYQFFKGQKLKCRIEDINRRRPVIRLLEVLSTVTQNAFSISEDHFLELIGTRDWDYRSLAHLLLTNEIDSDFTDDSLAWLLDVLKRTPLGNGANPLDLLNDIRECCLYLLEDTDLLTRIGLQEQQVLDERFSILVELIDNVRETCSMSSAKVRKDFVNNVLSKLKKSGHLYHPRHDFGILRVIFALQPESMTERMPEIFSVLCSRKMAYWKQDTFRREFVRLLERYIRHVDSQISQLSSADRRIDYVFKALALQLILIDRERDTDLVDIRLNHAMFYRYASYRNHSSDLISVAFKNICGHLQEFNFNQANAINDDLLPFHIVTLNDISDADDEMVFVYETRNQRLRVKSGNISLSLNTPGDTREVLPASLLPWNNIQVRLGKKPKTAVQAQNATSIRPYATMWGEILNTLFPTNPVSKPAREAKRKKEAGEGDDVFITIKGRSGNDPAIFDFVIDDPIFETAEGWMHIKEDVAGYYVNASPSIFCDSFGKPYHLLARITGINPETDRYHFRIIDILQNFNEWLDYEYDTTTKICYVGDINIPGCFAVSEDGIPVFISRQTPGFEMLRKGDIVEVSGLHHEGFPRLHADSFRVTSINHDFDMLAAYQRLIILYAEGKNDIYEEDIENQNAEESDNGEINIMMETSHARELMLLIDRIATISGEHIKAYNYLAMARTMAKMLGMAEQERYYYGQMKMIEFLNEFEVNDCNDEEQLNKFYNENNEFFSNYPSLYNGFRQLEFLSYLGRPDNNAILWGAQNTETNELLRKIAKLVLSYNILTGEGLEKEADAAQQRVKSLLNLKNIHSNLKEYGKESQTKEFKTSILFPPASANPRPQMETILRVISSFLNSAEGGTLYVGVNDQGMGEGVENDLNDPRFFNDKDKYERYLLDNIRRYLGPYADRCCRVEWERHSERDIMIVHIGHSEYLIKFNGQVFERNNSRTLPVEIAQLSEFMQRQGLDFAPESHGTEERKPAPRHTDADYDTEDTRSAYDITSNATARIASARSEYGKRIANGIDDDYTRYLMFDDDGRKYMMAPSFPGDGALCLGCDDNDAEAFLVIVWEDGTITRIPLCNFFNISEWQMMDINNHLRIVFATIAREDDLLMFYYRSGLHNYLRFDSVSNLCRVNSFAQYGKTVTDSRVDKVIACDLLSIESTAKIKSIVDVKADNPGMDIKDHSSLLFAVERALGYSLPIPE